MNEEGAVILDLFRHDEIRFEVKNAVTILTGIPVTKSQSFEEPYPLRWIVKIGQLLVLRDVHVKILN